MMISSGAKAIKPLGPVPCAISERVACEDIMDIPATLSSRCDRSRTDFWRAPVADAPSASAEALRHSARRRKPALWRPRVEPAPDEGQVLLSLCGNLKSSASAPKGDLKMQALCHG